MTESDLRKINLKALKPSGVISRSGEIMVAVINITYLIG